MSNCKHNGYIHLTDSVFRLWNVQVSAVPSCCTSFRSLTSYKVDLLMLRNLVFRLRIAQKWALPSRNGVDLLMLRNRVFRMQNIQTCEVATCKDFYLLKLRKHVLRLRNVQKWQNRPARWLIFWCSGIAISICENFRYRQYLHVNTSIYECSGIAFSGCESFKYGQCCQAMWLICWFSWIAF